MTLKTMKHTEDTATKASRSALPRRAKRCILVLLITICLVAFVAAGVAVVFFDIGGMMHDLVLRYNPQKARLQCLNHLSQIDGAQDSWALENEANHGDPVTRENVELYLEDTMHALRCPRGGEYILGPVGTSSYCSYHRKGHGAQKVIRP
jgi:hypothetical protein